MCDVPSFLIVFFLVRHDADTFLIKKLVFRRKTDSRRINFWCVDLTLLPDPPSLRAEVAVIYRVTIRYFSDHARRLVCLGLPRFAQTIAVGGYCKDLQIVGLSCKHFEAFGSSLRGSSHVGLLYDA